MTIICWDGKNLVADGRVTAGDVVVTDCDLKLFRCNIEYMGDVLYMYGAAGAANEHSSIEVYFLEGGEFPLDTKNKDSTILLIGYKWAYELEPGCKYPTRYSLDQKLAIGSGWLFGLSAMALGKSAAKAVKHACTMSVSCGGSITVWERQYEDVKN